MLQGLKFVPVLLSDVLVALGLSVASTEEGEGAATPWWVWLLIIVAFAFFALVMYWWWIRGKDEAPSEGEHRWGSARHTGVDAFDSHAELPGEAESPAPSLEVKAQEAELPEAWPDAGLEAAVRPSLEMPQPASEPDDLKIIEGIGPKIAGILTGAGITTFAQLAGTQPEQIRRILEQANPNLLRLADPTTWPEQARLAAAGLWEDLEALQGALKGGRR